MVAIYGPFSMAVSLTGFLLLAVLTGPVAAQKKEGWQAIHSGTVGQKNPRK
jgi:biotin transporter BioY